MSDYNYEEEKLEAKKRIESGEFDIEILENDGPDYTEVENDDLAAFEEHIKSDASKFLATEVLGK